MRGKATLLLLASILASAAHAQTIGGRVLDSASRLPAQRVAVRVLGDRDTVLAQTSTDTSGVFYAFLAGPGRVRLRFELAEGITFRTDTLTLAGDQFLQREFVIALPRVYDEFLVEKQATSRPGGRGPSYPPGLRERGISGTVLARFVVDTTGLAIPGTFRALKATDEEFVSAVRASLPTLRFFPAEVKGQKVRQVVQQEFTFQLTSDRFPPRTSIDSFFPEMPRGRPRP
jgi:hypothetical protein